MNKTAGFLKSLLTEKKGEIATILTVATLGLMLIGTFVGTKLAEKSTEQRTQAKGFGELKTQGLSGCQIIDTDQGPGCWCSEGGWQFHCFGGSDPNAKRGGTLSDLCKGDCSLRNGMIKPPDGPGRQTGASCTLAAQEPSLGNCCGNCIASKRPDLRKFFTDNGWGHCSDTQLINNWCNGISDVATKDCNALKTGDCSADCSSSKDQNSCQATGGTPGGTAGTPAPTAPPGGAPGSPGGSTGPRNSPTPDPSAQPLGYIVIKSNIAKSDPQNPPFITGISINVTVKNLATMSIPPTVLSVDNIQDSVALATTGSIGSSGKMEYAMLKPVVIRIVNPVPRTIQLQADIEIPTGGEVRTIKNIPVCSAQNLRTSPTPYPTGSTSADTIYTTCVNNGSVFSETIDYDNIPPTPTAVPTSTPGPSQVYFQVKTHVKEPAIEPANPDYYTVSRANKKFDVKIFNHTLNNIFQFMTIAATDFTNPTDDGFGYSFQVATKLSEPLSMDYQNYHPSYDLNEEVFTINVNMIPPQLWCGLNVPKILPEMTKSVTASKIQEAVARKDAGGSGYVNVEFFIDCEDGEYNSSYSVTTESLLGSSNEKFRHAMDKWVKGELNVLQMSSFISQLTRAPGLQISYCDPRKGECNF